MSDLAKRAIACKHWRWMPGMSATADGYFGSPVIVDVDYGDPCLPDSWAYRGYLRGRENADRWPEDMTPDLTDPATLGCLLALVREAWGDPHLHVGRRIAGWGVWTSASTPMPQCVGKGDAEAEALVAALEAAERREVKDERLP